MSFTAVANDMAYMSSHDHEVRLEAQRASAPHRTAVQKGEAMRQILADEVNGFKRLGVGMVGPIQLFLRYQGLVRNVLLEDVILPGQPLIYDVFNDLGQAYVSNMVDGEVRTTIFETTRINLEPYFISTYPQVREQDLLLSRVNVVEQAQDASKQAIMKQEDAILIAGLDQAVTTASSDPDHEVTPNHVIQEASGYLTPGSFYSAVQQIDMHQIQASRILINPYDYRDLYRWSINETGWAFKDRVVAGEKITSFGEFQIQRSLMVPQGTVYLVPDPQFLGVFPVRQALTITEDHNPRRNRKGWVLKESVSQAVLNNLGLSKVVKVA